MDIVRLRTMTLKSYFNEGKYKDIPLQKLLDLFYYGYLRWVYYNYEKITYTDDILKILSIKNEFIIQKPGKNPEMNEKLKLHLKKYLCKGKYLVFRDGDEVKYKNVEKNFKQKKYKIAALNAREKIYFSKASLQSRNQGH